VQHQAAPGVDRTIFTASVTIAVGVVAWGAISPTSLASVADSVLGWIIRTFGWAFVLSTLAFVVLAAFLALSRYGSIRLGADDDEPEFRTTSWVAMMFSAGMGIGLMFYGVAEPLSHLGAPPFGAAKPATPEAARVAMDYAYFHWAFHPWAIYAVVGLALAYFTFRKGQPNLISSAFRPLFGDRVEGPLGKSIDTLAVLATLFGSAASLGLGALQINSGLNFLWGVDQSNALAVLVILVLTGLFVLSAISGVEKGIQWLSNGNMLLAILLLAFLLVVGPTIFIFDTLTEGVGAYVTSLVPFSFRTGAFGDREWLASWTIFYWAWWISWAPFVGTFIARISKGRTIGQFVLGVLLIPSGVTFVWFAILGGSAIDLQLTGQADLIATIDRPEVTLFTTLEQFPLSDVTSFVVILLVALFFISGADAASVVMGMLSSHGNLEPNKLVVIVFGALTGAAAAVLLVAGGLQGLQQGAIIVAAPFLVVMLGLCVGLLRALSDEPARPRTAPSADVGTAPAAGGARAK
jgi:glycine betaine transporter